MFSNVAEKEINYISFADFKNSYSIGSNTEYLKIRSAKEKGRIENRKRFLDDALNFPYIQPNSDYNLKWLVFDIDRDFSYLEISDKNLKEPNFIVYNKENNHVQLWYSLKNAIWLQDDFKKNKAYQFYKIVYKRIREILKADKNFNQKLCKNPFYSDVDKSCTWFKFDIHNYSYSLNELAEHLDLNIDFEEEKKTDFKIIEFDFEETLYSGVSKGERNSSLFDYVRKLAYRYYSKTECKETELYNYCLTLLKESDLKNIPSIQNTNIKELETIAKSISGWTIENINPRKKKEIYTESQRKKSLYIRQKKAKVKKAKVKKLLKNNSKISNREISRILGSGFSTATVNKYVKEIENEKKLKNSSKIKNENFVNQFVKGFVCPDGVNLFDDVNNLFLKHRQQQELT